MVFLALLRPMSRRPPKEVNVPALIKDLYSSKPHIAQGAARELMGLGEQVVPALVEALSGPYRQEPIYDVLYLMGKPAVSGLLKILEAGKPEERIVAADVLGKIQAYEARELLEKAMSTSKDPMMRRAAANALGDMMDDRAVPALIKALKSDKNAMVRAGAAYALGSFNGTLYGALAPKHLIRSLRRDKSPDVRSASANALGMLEAKAAIPSLIRALDEKSVYTVRAVIEALGSIRSDRAVPALLRKCRDKDPEVRRAAVGALGLIASPKAFPELLRILQKDDDISIRMFAGRSLRYIAGIHGVGAPLLRAVREAMSALRDEVKKDRTLEDRERFLKLIDEELTMLAQGRTMVAVPQRR